MTIGFILSDDVMEMIGKKLEPMKAREYWEDNTYKMLMKWSIYNRHYFSVYGNPSNTTGGGGNLNSYGYKLIKDKVGKHEDIYRQINRKEQNHQKIKESVVWFDNNWEDRATQLYYRRPASYYNVPTPKRVLSLLE